MCKIKADVRMLTMLLQWCKQYELSSCDFDFHFCTVTFVSGLVVHPRDLQYIFILI